MAERKYVRTIPGMRIDQPDFNQAAVESQRQADEQLLDQMFMDPDFQTGLILGGFDYSHASGIVTITRGRAIVSYRDNGQIRRGMLIAEGGPVQKQLSVAALANGTYTIYLRGKYSNVDPANRVVWNADATTPVEVGTLMATRVAEDWDLLIALSASVVPAEWIPLYQVVVAGSIVTSSTDLRNFFFEGTAANSFAVTDAEFGDTNDRSTARGANGVTNIRKAIRGLQRQVQDIIGSSGAPGLGWYKSVSVGSSLANKLARDGSNTVLATIFPDINNDSDLGLSSRAFRAMYSFLQSAQQLSLDLQNTSATDLLAGIVMSYSGSSGTRTKRLLFQAINAAGPGTLGRIYIGNRGSTPSATTFYIQFIHNAVWDNTTNLWSRVQAGDSYILEFGSGGVRVGVHVAADPATWSDTFGAGTWTTTFANGDAGGTIVTATGVIPTLTVGTSLELGSVSGNGLVTVPAAAPTLLLLGASPINTDSRQLYFGGATPALGLHANNTAFWDVRLPNGFVVTAVSVIVSGSTSASRTFDVAARTVNKATNTVTLSQSVTTGPIASTSPTTFSGTLGTAVTVNNVTSCFQLAVGSISAADVYLHHIVITGYLPTFAP
jgi:hypothetical protein